MEEVELTVVRHGQAGHRSPTIDNLLPGIKILLCRGSWSGEPRRRESDPFT